MSTAAEQIVVSSATVERRFYERVCPSGVVSIALGENNPGMLLNASENGLLVSTPNGLARDSVFPLSLGLDGLPNSVEVIGRVVWTAETNRAGIQLLNLRDHDREQIRVWVTRGSAGNADSAQFEARRNGRQTRMDGSVQDSRGRKFKRFSLGLGAATAMIVLAMGLSLRGSPLRTWLSRSSKAAPKNSGVVSKSAETASPIDNEAPVSSAISLLRPSDRAANSKMVGEKQIAGPATPQNASDSRGKSVAAPSGTIVAAPVRKDLSGKKNVRKANSTAHLAEASLTKSEVTSDAASAVDPEAEKSEEDGTKAKTEAENPLPAPPGANSGASSPAPGGEPISAAPNSAPQPEVNPKAPPLSPPSPIVIQMEGPKSQVVEITLPNGPGATLLALPGEKVIQSAAVTMHVQRSILVPGGQGWWSSNRKKKIVLGELLERVEPQTLRLRNDRTGRVSVRAMIAKDGHVERVRPVTGSIALVPSVVRAIRMWRFEPTLLDGKAIETSVTLSVEFHATASGASTP